MGRPAQINGEEAQVSGEVLEDHFSKASNVAIRHSWRVVSHLEVNVNHIRTLKSSIGKFAISQS